MARSQAGRLIGTAMALRTRLPKFREAMARGELALYRVTLIDQATCNVTDELIGEVERQVLDQVLAPADPGGTGLTGERLTNAVNRIVDRIDPAGVRRRRLRATHERSVGISGAEDGMVRIFGSLPAEDGRKLDGRLRELANTVCLHDPRTFDQRKADAVTALVDGLTFLPCRCGRTDCTQDPGDVPVARKPLVHVIMLDSTLTGADDEPGYLDGYGLINADHVREVAADADIVPVRVPDDVTVDRAHRAAGHDHAPAEAADPQPAAADHAPSTVGHPAAHVADPLPASAFTYHPNQLLDTWIRILAGMCQWLHCDVPAWNADIDHDESFNHRDPREGGKTIARDMKPYCRNHHRLKHAGDWTETHNRDRTIDLIAPTGHHYRTRNAGYLDVLGLDPDEPPPF